MAEGPQGIDIVELAAELTAAWLSNPKTKVTADELPGVIQTIHSALGALGTTEPAEVVPEYTPAVSVRRSLASRDRIISMIDGKPYRMLKRHLALNGLTPAEYRERYGLRPDYPMVAESYAEKRRELAKTTGLGRKLGQKAETAKPGQSASSDSAPPSPPATSTVPSAPAASNQRRDDDWS